MAKSAYIHIPFCAHKCDFCDFAAFAGVDDLTAEYCQVVASEIQQRILARTKQDKLDSLFYGGGTPGYIDPTQLELVHRSIEKFVGFEPGAEITLETTPQSITSEKLKCWQEIGINRLSIGVQSFHDAELVAMGRDHTAKEALDAIESALESGFKNVALDLMYGLPEQTMDSWRSTLRTALSLGLPHMSAYGLTIEVNSPLLLRYPRDSKAYPDEDMFVEMYSELIEACATAGLMQYEVSNFARAGFESKHNICYWSNEEYLAFGVSAHRYVDGVRSSNFRALKRYMRDALADETREVVDELTKMKEGIFLGLRMRRGLNLDDFKRKYSEDLETSLADKIEVLRDGGFLVLEDGWLRLSQKGVLVSNLVLSELV